MARKYRLHPQHPVELQKLAKWLRGVDSILEIGSRYGENLKFMANQMSGKRLVSVDLPDAEGWNDSECEKRLKGSVNDLKKAGFDVTLILGDSHQQDTFNKVAEHAPFDAVFIDGDHTYEGVKQDWLMYGPLGKQVIFHDIKPGNKLGVSVFWDELNVADFEFMEDFIAKDSKMGIGRVVRKNI